MSTTKPQPPSATPALKCSWCHMPVSVEAWLAMGKGRRSMLICPACVLDERNRELAVHKPVKWGVG